jgi:hypothetical protein
MVSWFLESLAAFYIPQKWWNETSMATLKIATKTGNQEFGRKNRLLQRLKYPAERLPDAVVVEGCKILASVSPWLKFYPG